MQVVFGMSFIVYLLKWQLSSPLLIICLARLSKLGYVGSIIVTNLIGGIIFYWIDLFIFTKLRRK